MADLNNSETESGLIPNQVDAPVEPQEEPRKIGKLAQARIELKELQAKLDEANNRITELETYRNDQYKQGYEKGLTEARTSDDNSNSWYNRATYAEARVEKLKDILAEVMAVITKRIL